MSVTIPDGILRTDQMSAGELRQELAVLLFQRERLTLAQTGRRAEMDRLRSQHLLSSRGTELHDDVAAIQQDLRTLQEFRRL